MQIYAQNERTPLHENFNLQSLRTAFIRRNIHERISLIHDWFKANNDGQLALSSSFGVQSASLLHYVRESGLDIPVVSVDIAQPEYDLQRSYKQTLQRALQFPLLDFPAPDDAGKVAALDKGLRDHNITGLISGIRASQTQARAKKEFVEYNPRNNTLSFHPLLDWSDAKTDYYLDKRIPEHLRHPHHGSGVRSKGGAVLAPNEEKTECGIHLG